MAILSRKDLERISRKMLHQYLKQRDEKITWIDPVDFAERICGIQFVFADIGAGGAVLGLTSFTDGAVTIPSGNGMGKVFQLDGRTAYVDQSLLDEGQCGRLNFTMMHEAAHQILAHLFPTEYGPQKQPFVCRLADERCSRPITDWPEWQTNVLTSYLLLPRELIYKRMADLGLGKEIRLLNRVFAPKEYELFSQMAELLGVSKTALSIRLSQLGLVGRNDFYDPYALVNVYKDEDDN